jgi:hypothetical protein
MASPDIHEEYLELHNERLHRLQPEAKRAWKIYRLTRYLRERDDLLEIPIIDLSQFVDRIRP